MSDEPIINRLGTACYSLFRPDMGVPVATSVGKPKWMPGIDAINEMAPYGLLTGYTEFEFRLKYHDRLDKNEDKVKAALLRLSAKYPGERLVLLCWEDLRKPDLWCHRTMLAEWLEARGLTVPELTTGEVFDARPGRNKPDPDPWKAETLF